MTNHNEMPGGRTGGAVHQANTVVRPGGPWTDTVHTVLRHLETVGFQGAPRVAGVNEKGEEILTFLVGETVGIDLPWPPWVYSDQALTQVGTWLRRLHDATATFIPPDDATWLIGTTWRPGLVIGHHDAAPYNAVWNQDGLVGFVDWDTAGPSSPDLDLAFTALWWTPLTPHKTTAPRGFSNFADRSRRLHLLLDAYGYTGDRNTFGTTIARRARINATAVHRLAATGNPIYQALLPTADDLEQAAAAIEQLPTAFWIPPGT